MSDRPNCDWLTKWEYAHRGLHSFGVPENSLAAAEAAIAAGMGVECDIQRSFDDVPMVFHDWELNRLTTTEGLTEDLTAKELEALVLQGTNERLIKLETLLSEVAGQVPLLIELKSRPDYDVERTCAQVSKLLADYSGDFALMSFDPRVAAWSKRYSPQTICGLVMREDEHGYTQTQAQRNAAFDKAQPDFLAYHIAALPNPWVAELRGKGLPILTWTVNSPETRARALQHTDALISEGEGLA